MGGSNEPRHNTNTALDKIAVGGKTTRHADRQVQGYMHAGTEPERGARNFSRAASGLPGVPHRKLNCHTHSSPLMRGKLPSMSVKVKPNWISLSMSTFSLRA